MNVMTTRLVIRNYHPEDQQALYAMIRGYQTSGMSAYDEPWPTEPAAYEAITAYLASTDHFMAVCLLDGTFIGHITLMPEAGDVYNLGYIFDARYHGHGYATEACRAVLEHAFQMLGAARIVSGTAAINTPSVRLLERLGFRQVGEGRVSFQKDMLGKPIEFAAGKWELMREEWLAYLQHRTAVSGISQYGPPTD